MTAPLPYEPMWATPDQTHRISYEYSRRKISRSPLIEQARRVTAAYNNEIALPLPELASSEATPVANLISSGIDQHAMRIADVLPDIQCPPVKLNIQKSIDTAALRRRACYGYWDRNAYELSMRKRARWLVAYATCPVWIRPDAKQRGPVWELRSPLNTYPSDEDTMTPDNVIFAHTQTVAWLQKNYPQIPLSQILVCTGTYTDRRGLYPEDPVEIIQWVDRDNTITIATGCGYTSTPIREAEYGINDAQIINLTAAGDTSSMWAAGLTVVPNRAGVVPAVTPGRISLDVRRGQFDDAIGLYAMQAALAAMEVNAIANGIWPDQWLVPNQPGDTPQIITPANGRAGKIGRISGGTVMTVQMQPGIQTPTAIDRLERGIRLSASVPADFSGESPSNVRTARRGAAVLSEAVDYTLAEHQQILARSMQHELEIAAAIDVAYFGAEKKSFYVNWPGSRGRLDYTPNDIWGDDRTIHVSYAKAGADTEQLAVEAGQLVGTGLISKDTAMRLHPMVEDPDHEQGQIVAESLDAALLSSLQQGATSGQLAVMDIAAIKQKVKGGTDLEAAVLAQQQEAQARQAQQVEPTAPEAQPGLSAPGAGAEANAAIQGPAPSVDNLSMLLRAIRTPSQVAAAG